MLGAGKNTVEIIIAAKDRFTAPLVKAKAQMKGLQGGAGRLGGAMNGLKSKLSGVTSSLGGFGSALGPVGIVVAGVAVVMATMGGAAIKASLEFEKAVATIRVGTGATGDTLAGLEGSFKTVFTSVPTSTANAATAIADLNTRLGLTGEPLEALATQFLNLSRITGTDVSASISSATRVMHDFAVSSEEQSGALDYLFKVSQSTGLGMTQLSNSMTQYGSVMRQMGFDINESAALLGKFEKEGVNLQLVLGSLRQGLAKFSKAGEEPVEALARVSAEIQSMGSVADANALAIETFGARAGPDMAAAIREGRFSIEELMATLDASGETINKAAADTLTFGDKWTLLKNNIMEAIAPIGDVITNVLGNAIEGVSASFNMLQAVIGPIIGVFKGFFDAISSAVSSALAPLTERLAELQQKFTEGSGALTIFSDIFTIVAAAAKWLGEAIGTLVTMALTPLVTVLKAGLDMLGAFYEKLGPIKGALEWVGESFHNVAESVKEVKPPIEEVKTALATLADEGSEGPKAVADAWALAIKDFQEGAGTYKEALDGVNDKIAKLTEEYMTATDKRKTAIEKEVELVNREKDALEELKQTAEDALSSTAKETEEATQKMEEFKVTIGDTTIEFKGAAAEVVKNADAYEKLQKSAKTLIDLDWSTFTEFEAALPNIEAGILDMESSFVGLKDILEENIGSLENVKASVMDIADIAAPFLEAGFVDGIKSIGSFAGSLKDAGSAINTFSSLQDVSIEGCINFSMHVHDMVSALEILEDQMEDLVPSFMEMDSLISDIADAFLYGGDKVEVFTKTFENEINAAYSIMNNAGIPFDTFSKIVENALDTGSITFWNEGIARWTTNTVTGVSDVVNAFQQANRETGEVFLAMDPSKMTNRWGHGFDSYTGKIEKWGATSLESFKEVSYAMRDYVSDTYNVTLSADQLYELMKKPPEEQKKWLDDLMHSEKALTFQMDKQTNALKAQTGQLSKITKALQPYLEFMRTLNELAALSALSTEELNNGLNAINDTLVNLGKSLETFDLRPVMETLFGTKIAAGEFTGGIATGFTDTMIDFATPFSNLIVYVERLSYSIFSLVSSFEALAKISDSVLADQTKLKEVFEGITDVMSNFSTEMGGTEGFAQKFADGMDAMLKSAAPLIKYFQDNNAAVELFNKSLSTFGDTAVNTIGVFEDLASVVERSSDLIVVSAEDIETALSLVDDQLKEIAEYLRSPAWSEIAIQLASVGKEWKKWAVDVDLYMPAFDSAVNTFSTLTSNILGLSSALKDMRDMSVLSVRDIDEALKNIPVFLDRFVDALALNMYEIKRTLKELDIEWSLHTEEMKATIPAYEDSTDKINKLISPILSLNSALQQLAEMGTISSTTFDKGFSSLMSTISNFAVSLGRNVDGLIISLSSLRKVWIENEDVLYPLIYDFAIISDNLFGAAHNANRMSEEFKNISENAGTLEKGFKSLIEFIYVVVDLTKEFYTTKAAAELATYIEDVGKVITSFVNLERELKTAMGNIKSAIGSAVDTVAGKISSLGTLTTVMYNSGANIMQSLINGIWSKTFDLASAVGYQAMIIQAYLGASSNTKLGPLSHLEDFGPNIVRTISEGIRSEMPTLNAAFGSLSPSMAAGTASGRGGNVTLYNTQYISDKDTADYANQGLERLLSRHSIM